MTEHSDPRLLTPEALAASVAGIDKVEADYLSDAPFIRISLLARGDMGYMVGVGRCLLAHIDAQAAVIARLRAVAEAAQRLVAGADDIDLDWRLARDDGQGEEIVYNSHLHDLADALAALDAGGEAAGDE